MEENLDKELPLLKYEATFLKRLNLPQEPRLFCLTYNGVSVDYEGDSKPEEGLDGNCPEREAVIFKEIHNFT